ncbi:MAG TPA: hypothetical protein VGK41_02295, partial [Solirubrobacterales bacterium]
HISGIHQPPECETRIQNAPGPSADTQQTAPVELSPGSGSLSLAEEGPASSVESENNMADGQNISATPYPFYATGNDDGDDAFKAQLISHANASVERNQDAQFASMSRQALQHCVDSSAKETVQAKYDLAVLTKDAEVRNVERFAELKSELATIRAEGIARDNAALARELSDVKASARDSQTAQLLAAILAKLA